MTRFVRPAVLILVGVLAGCASRGPGVPEPVRGADAPYGSPSSYAAEPGRDAASVAELRAAAAPAVADVALGRNAAGDRERLATQSFVQIGSARYPGDEPAAREAATHQARSVGADRVLLYPPAAPPATATTAAPRPDWLATFFVRFRLLFGATFRNLEATERTALGSAGVQIGSVVGGTPASRANLVAGDVVVALDGKPTPDRATFQNLLRQNSGRSVTLSVVRNGETLQRPVKLGALPGGER